MPIRRFLSLLALPVLAPAIAAAQPTLPLKHQPEATKQAITAADLMTRLYIYADDSMQGRYSGTPGHVRATNYIESEVRKLGLKPAGDNGTFFQTVPVFQRSADPNGTIAVGGATLRVLQDFVTGGGRGGGDPKPIDGAQVVFGGTAGDTINPLTADQVRGKFVVVYPAPGAGRGGGRGGGGFAGRGGQGGAAQALAAAMAEAAAVATIAGDALPDQALRAAQPQPGSATGYVWKGSITPVAPTASPLQITAHAAEVLLGVPATQATKGMAGKTVRGAIRFVDRQVPARNVAAILEGSDPKLKGQYVAMGGHSDHNGIRPAVDHDSLHLAAQARFQIVGMNARGTQQTSEQQAALANIHVNLDSVRRLRPVRLDSIQNGADDDGSGTVVTLELAEAFAKLPAAQRPKRSLLFVWHVGEEEGLWGSDWVTQHPPVPRDSIVAQLNMDMVGRGEKWDLPVGGPDYLQLVGSRRLSTELGDLVESVNRTEKMPFRFDYQFDAAGHMENIYCRSDHYNYARYGIPITFFTTGLHGDYHQNTDEPQYIAYDHLARIGQLVYDVAVRVANLDHRVAVDALKPDPTARCTNNGAPPGAR